jgi:hypothetical protein
MRLKTVRKGESFATRLKLALIGMLFSQRTPDVVRTAYHRPEFFGRHFAELVQSVLNGPSSWARGDRELFAAFVSSLNRCLF